MTVTNQSSFPSTWKDQIVTNPKADELLVDSPALLNDITPDKDTDYLLNILTGEESYILVKTSDSNICPTLIHHPVAVKGTRAEGGIGTNSLILHQGLSARFSFHYKSRRSVQTRSRRTKSFLQKPFRSKIHHRPQQNRTLRRKCHYFRYTQLPHHPSFHRERIHQ